MNRASFGSDINAASIKADGGRGQASAFPLSKPFWMRMVCPTVWTVRLVIFVFGFAAVLKPERVFDKTRQNYHKTFTFSAYFSDNFMIYFPINPNEQ